MSNAPVGLFDRYYVADHDLYFRNATGTCVFGVRVCTLDGDLDVRPRIEEGGYFEYLSMRIAEHEQSSDYVHDTSPRLVECFFDWEHPLNPASSNCAILTV